MKGWGFFNLVDKQGKHLMRSTPASMVPEG